MQNWTIQIPSNPCHLSLPTESLAQSLVPSIGMRSQVVSMAFVTTVVFLVAAGAPFTQETLGLRAATLPSSTKLIYMIFAFSSTCLLPTNGLLCPPFAPARRAHAPTGRPALSPLSAGAARCRGGHGALKAGALEHLLAEGHRAVQAAPMGQKFRRLRRAESDRGRPLHSAAGALWWLRKVVFGVLF